MSDDYNDVVLRKFLKTLKSLDTIKVKVGILGDGDIRRDNIAKPGKKFKGGAISVQSNAEIGMKHEFGDPEHNLPMRSFLRMPLTKYLQGYLDKSKGFTPEALRKVIQEGDVTQWMTKIGIVAETVVNDAFDSGGFGQWTPSNMENKKVHQTLVETQQLRNSITSEVTGGD